MGYSTDFSGEFELDRPLEEAHLVYLEAFAGTRRMRRNAAIAETMPDPIRLAAGLPIGEDGAYFVGGLGFRGQDHDASVDTNSGNHNYSPSAQPGLWCQWEPNEDGTCIVWDEGEKFYEYVAWLEYIIVHFLKPWGYTLNGEVEWVGEDSDDRGVIVVKNNRVGTQGATTEYHPVQWLDGAEELDERWVLMEELQEAIQHAQTNLTSIDTAMRNAAVPGSVAQAAWEAADRWTKKADATAGKLRNLLAP